MSETYQEVLLGGDGMNYINSYVREIIVKFQELEEEKVFGEIKNYFKDDKEISEYLINTTAIKKALTKQIPKKVTHEATLYKCCTCPNCKNVVDKFEKWGENTVRITQTYCHFCGQKLDWEVEDETNS